MSEKDNHLQKNFDGHILKWLSIIQMSYINFENSTST